MNMKNIEYVEIINAPDNTSYTSNIILNILNQQQVAASYGHKFTGRPVTNLVSNGTDLIKLRTEYNYPEHEARKYIEQAIEKEKKLKIYHPLKTWFLITEKHEDSTKNICIANISPLLQALHQTDEVLLTIRKKII